MPDIQNGYPTELEPARAGMIANSLDTDVVSASCETANVAFGVAMVEGDAAGGVKVAAAGYFRGVTLREPALPPGNGDKYQVGDGVSLLTRGTVWVVSTGAPCVAGNPVYRTAAGALTPTAAGNTLIDRAYFETAAAAGALARIRLH